jgi:tetratricopeptide (TPR) repeat protein
MKIVSRADERLAAFLRGAVLVVAAALLLLLPEFRASASFLGAPGLSDPVTVLLIGLAFWVMPALVVASWVAENRVCLAHGWMAAPVVLWLLGAVVSTASASDKSSALVRAAEMTGLGAAFFALLQAVRTDADRRFLLAVVLASALVPGALAIHPGSPGPAAQHPAVLAAVLVLATCVGAGFVAEKLLEARPRMAFVPAVAAVTTLTALVLSWPGWAPGALAESWRAALAVIRDHWATGVGLENFGHHYLEHKAAAAPDAVTDPANLWLSAWSQLGLAGLAAAGGLAVLAARAGLRGRRSAATPAGEDRPLLGLLGPTVLLAAPAVIALFPIGWRAGAVALGVMALVAGLAAGENPSRLKVPGRPLRLLGAACVAGAAAWLVLAQVEPALLSAPASWALLVVVAAGLSRRAGTGPPAGTSAEPSGSFRIPLGLAFILMLAVMAGAFAYVKCLLLPVAREGALLAAATQAEGDLDMDETLRKAGQANPLAWEPAYLRGSFWQARAAEAEGPEQAMATDKAIRAYGEALARHPRLGEAYVRLAACRLAVSGAFEDAGALQAAREYLARAAELAPTDPPTRLRLADVTDRLGEDAEALAEYRRALQLDAQAPPQRRLADDERQSVERRIGQLEESLEGTTGGSPG